MRSACLVLALAIGCDTAPTAPDESVVAFSESGTGKLGVVGVPSGTRLQVLEPTGSPGAISVSPDRTQVAFSVEPELFARHVHVGDVATGLIREVTPQTGQSSADFRWGVGGWFRYYSPSGILVAEPGSTTARLLGTSTVDLGNELASPTEPRIAYTECSSGSGYECPRQLVSERIDGSQRTVIAMTDGLLWPLAFTHDGTGILVYEERADGYHLIVRAVSTGAETDLGVADPTLAQSWAADGITPISPDGLEVLTVRGPSLIARKLDGTGERLIANALPARAGFTGAGDVVYELERNLSTTHEPDVRHDLVLARGGTSLVLATDEQDCWPSFTSPGGEHVAWDCSSGISVFRLADGTVERTDADGVVLGFDRDDLGMVTAHSTGAGPLTYRITYTTHDGDVLALGNVWYQDTPLGFADWRPFSFRP